MDRISKYSRKAYATASASIGIRKGRAPRNAAADVIKPCLVARHRGFDLAQRTGAGQLAVQQRNQLVTGRELAHQVIAAVLVHKPIEHPPRNEFEWLAENAILMPHGVDPLSCPDVSKPSGSEKNQCRALLQAQNVPDSRGLVPAIHDLRLRQRRGCPAIRAFTPVFDELWPGMTAVSAEHSRNRGSHFPPGGINSTS